MNDKGDIRAGCKIIKKGEVYEERFFNKKIKQFKDKDFLKDIKVAYAELINEQINDENEKLKVFNKDGIYLPMKKIGKNNPNEKNIKANNRMVLEWNDIASQVVERMPAENIREINKEEIQKPLQEIYKIGEAIGNRYGRIVGKAITTLVNFFNRWIMLSKDSRPRPGEDFFYRLLERCRPRVKTKADKEWER